MWKKWYTLRTKVCIKPYQFHMLSSIYEGGNDTHQCLNNELWSNQLDYQFDH